jgi:hypothetical protein
MSIMMMEVHRHSYDNDNSAYVPPSAEAAFQLLSNSTDSPVKHHTNHTNLYCVAQGQPGKLVLALIVN